MKAQNERETKQVLGVGVSVCGVSEECGVQAKLLQT